MVKAISDEKKTVTRRPLKTQPPEGFHFFGVVQQEAWFSERTREQINKGCVGHYFVLDFPYGKIGDVLSITEPWKVHKNSSGAGVYFEDGGFRMHSKAEEFKESNGSWRSANSLPKWASRYRIRITDIGAERLQDISDEEIRKEGIYLDYLEPSIDMVRKELTRKELFILYWNLCYNESFPWDSNPWVWTLNFELV